MQILQPAGTSDIRTISSGLRMNASLQEVRSLLESASSVVLTTHINPDADGLGSECALAIFLQRRGKRVRIVNHSNTPGNCAFLDTLFPIEVYSAAEHDRVLAAADVIAILDTNHPDRVASMKQALLASPAKRVCIDHHPDPADFVDALFVETAYAATGMMVFELINRWDSTLLDERVATALYAAIMTDTGSFRFPKTDASVHRMIARLIEAGADPVAIYENIYERGSAGRLRLLGMLLHGLTLSHDGRVASVTITREMFQKTGTTEPETDAFVPYTLSIDGVQIGIMFTEMEDLVKVNFRSKGSVPVNALAREFGGNGHLNAAGARVTGASLQDLIPRVLMRAKHYVQ